MHVSMQNYMRLMQYALILFSQLVLFRSSSAIFDDSYFLFIHLFSPLHWIIHTNQRWLQIRSQINCLQVECSNFISPISSHTSNQYIWTFSIILVTLLFSVQVTSDFIALTFFYTISNCYTLKRRKKRQLFLVCFFLHLKFYKFSFLHYIIFCLFVSLITPFSLLLFFHSLFISLLTSSMYHVPSRVWQSRFFTISCLL